MHTLTNTALIFFAQARIEAINIAFQERKTEDSSNHTVLLSAVVIALLAAVAVFFIVKLRSERVVSDPRALFKELCKSHSLSRKHRRLLRLMSREKQLSNPSELMINAEHWTLDVNREPNLCSPKVRTEIQKLRALLYVPPRAIEN